MTATHSSVCQDRSFILLNGIEGLLKKISITGQRKTEQTLFYFAEMQNIPFFVWEWIFFIIMS